MNASDMALDFAKRRQDEKWGEGREHKELVSLIENAKALSVEWEEVGTSEHIAAKLSQTMEVNGLSMHLEAYQVTVGADGTLVPVLDKDSGLYVDWDAIHEALGADGEFQTMVYKGHPYVVMAFPFER